MGGRIGSKDVKQRGSIGHKIFEQFEQLTAGAAMKRLTAFKANRCGQWASRGNGGSQ